MKMTQSLTFAAATLTLTTAMTMTVFAAWQQDNTGWWYQNSDGSYPASTWQWIDGDGNGVAECYYFNEVGYLLTDAQTPDGYTVNADGAWVENGQIQTQQALNTDLAAMAPYQTAMRYPDGKVTAIKAIKNGYGYSGNYAWEINAGDWGRKNTQLIDHGAYYEVTNASILLPFTLTKEQATTPGHRCTVTITDQNGASSTIHCEVTSQKDYAGNYLVLVTSSEDNGLYNAVDTGIPGKYMLHFAEFEIGMLQAPIYNGSLYFSKDCIVYGYRRNSSPTLSIGQYLTQPNNYGFDTFQGGYNRYNQDGTFSLYGHPLFDPSTGLIVEFGEIFTS